MPPPPSSTLFPYTTLFRSRPWRRTRARTDRAPRPPPRRRLRPCHTQWCLLHRPAPPREPRLPHVPPCPRPWVRRRGLGRRGGGDEVPRRRRCGDRQRRRVVRGVQVVAAGAGGRVGGRAEGSAE